MVYKILTSKCWFTQMDFHHKEFLQKAGGKRKAKRLISQETHMGLCCELSIVAKLIIVFLAYSPS